MCAATILNYGGKGLNVIYISTLNETGQVWWEVRTDGVAGKVPWEFEWPPEVAFIWDSSQQFLQSEYFNQIIESYVLLSGQAGYSELIQSLFSSLKPKIANPNFSNQNLNQEKKTQE